MKWSELLCFVAGSFFGALATWYILTHEAIRVSPIFPDIFIAIAIAMSFLYGYFAERIFGNETQRKEADRDFGVPGHLH